ncbi:Ig domain-containing protein [bacterium]|nr:Ig domain-containing protein [bacterium]
MGKRHAFLASALLFNAASSADVQLYPYDIHDRNIQNNGVQLVDWDGFMANPAYRLRLWGPQEVPKENYPVSVRLFTPEVQVQFSIDGAQTTDKGAEAVFFITAADKPVDLEIVAWPDRDTKDTKTTLQILSKDAKDQEGFMKIPLHIRDQDRGLPEPQQTILKATSSYPFIQAPNLQSDVEPPTPFFSPTAVLKTPAPFNILLDVSSDESSFFEGQTAVRTARRALDDWAYFLWPIDVDPVEVGEEETPKMAFSGNLTGWQNEVLTQGNFKNAHPFKDLLIYLTATHTPSSRRACTGLGQTQRQKKGMKNYTLPRSAHILLGLSHPGMTPEMDEKRWWTSTASSRSSNAKDLYSYVLHEMGHALGVEPSNPNASGWTSNGTIASLAMEYYLGHPAPLNREYHIVKSSGVAGGEDEPETDPVSGFPAFGSVKGQFGKSPRWLISKLDILMLRAMGYPLNKNVSALQPLRLKTAKLESAESGKPFDYTFLATGGVYNYDWNFIGSLPPGLTLDRFTGNLSGTPNKSGIFRFLITVKDGALSGQQTDKRAYVLWVQ